MRTENNGDWMHSPYGVIWAGLHKADEDDMETMPEGAVPDELSLVGRYHPRYTAEIWERGETTTDPLGGKGSHTYETKRLGVKGGGDIVFRDSSDPIYHYDPDGNYVHGQLLYDKTGTGYHVDEYGMTHAGPRPGSAAERIIGDGHVEWDDKKDLWTVAS